MTEQQLIDSYGEFKDAMQEYRALRDIIESNEFAAEILVVSGSKQFNRVLREHEVVKRMQKIAETHHWEATQGWESAFNRLKHKQFDPAFENPNKVAMQVYLHLMTGAANYDLLGLF